LESRKWEEHKFLSGFSSWKSGVTTVEDAQDVKCTSPNKRDENVDPMKELLF